MKKSYLNNLILESYAEVISELNEAPDRMFYIKIPKDAASQNKAQVVLEDLYGIKYEIQDDPNGVVLLVAKSSAEKLQNTTIPNLALVIKTFNLLSPPSLFTGPKLPVTFP